MVAVLLRGWWRLVEGVTLPQNKIHGEFEEAWSRDDVQYPAIFQIKVSESLQLPIFKHVITNPNI